MSRKKRRLEAEHLKNANIDYKRRVREYQGELQEANDALRQISMLMDSILVNVCLKYGDIEIPTVDIGILDEYSLIAEKGEGTYKISVAANDKKEA